MPLGCPPRGFFFCTSNAPVTAPQQCGAVTAVLPSSGGLNGVGYANTATIDGETMTFIGASFENVGPNTFVPLSKLSCVEGFAEGDQIQMAVIESGIVNFKIYEYWESDAGWVDTDEMEVVGEDIGFSVGEAAWFVSTEPKQITFAGQVKSGPAIHTFKDSMTIIVSAFPVDFRPNSANISWGCGEGDQIQVPSMEDGIVNFKVYEYWESDAAWVDTDEMEVLDPDFAVNTVGKGFWFVTSNPDTVTFTEISPLAK